MERSEEEELDEVALSLLRFLGQVYVKLQEVQAVEEFLCEQYDASCRYLSQWAGSCDCSSIDPHLSGAQLGQELNETRQEHDLEALCRYLDKILAATLAIRENCDSDLLSKRRGTTIDRAPSRHKESSNQQPDTLAKESKLDKVRKSISKSKLVRRTLKPKKREAHPLNLNVDRSVSVPTSGSAQLSGESFKLHFPKEYSTFRNWLSKNDKSIERIVDACKTIPAAEESFLSILKIAYNEPHNGHEDATRVVPESKHFELVTLDPNFTAGQHVNFASNNILPSEDEVQFKTELQTRDQTQLIDPTNSCWLPQVCWEHSSRVLSCSQVHTTLNAACQDDIVTYSEPEQLIAIARVSHRIQVMLFQAYIQDKFGPVLLRKSCTGLENRKEENLAGLLLCQLGHAILCKEGRSLFVLAERVTTSA